MALCAACLLASEPIDEKAARVPEAVTEIRGAPLCSKHAREAAQ